MIIDHAFNGQEALNKVKNAYFDGSHSYGLIFMDFSMPVMDGYEACDLIKNFCRSKNILQAKVVGCTGHTEEEYIEKAWRHGIDEIVPKPAKVE